MINPMTAAIAATRRATPQSSSPADQDKINFIVDRIPGLAAKIAQIKAENPALAVLTSRLGTKQPESRVAVPEDRVNFRAGNHELFSLEYGAGQAVTVHFHSDKVQSIGVKFGGANVEDIGRRILLVAAERRLVSPPAPVGGRWDSIGRLAAAAA